MVTYVTFLPGASGSGVFWSPIIERLPHEWHGRAMDLPGLGNVPPLSEISSYDDLADYVARTLAGPTVIVAQSMGSYIALRMTLRYPRLVSHLVLTAATGGVAAASHGGEEWREDYAATYPDVQPWARAHVRDYSDEDLESIAIPVLLAWATRDPLSPLSIARRLASRIAGSTLKTFESDDHWFVHRFADEIARAIVESVTAA